MNRKGRQAKIKRVEKELLGPAKTANYRASQLYVPSWNGPGGFGAFTLSTVEEMDRDYQVQLALAYKLSPVESAEIGKLECGNATVKKFIEDTWKDFWCKSVDDALACVKYGFCGTEPIYKDEKGLLKFDTLKWIHPRDVRPYIYQGKLSYAKVRGQSYNGDWREKNLLGPEEDFPGKIFWCVFNPRIHPWYGRPGIVPAWYPWRIKTCPDGALESLFKAFYRYAFNGLIARHPEDSFDTEGNDNTVFARDVMRQIGQLLKSGANITLPSTRDEKGNYLYDIDKYGGESASDFRHLIDYPDFLDKLIVRGVGIPDEIITHDGNTGGYSRSNVALQAFWMMEQGLLNIIWGYFVDQILRPLVNLQFGEQDFVLEPKSLIPKEDPMQSGTGKSGQPPIPGQGKPEFQQQGGFQDQSQDPNTVVGFSALDFSRHSFSSTQFDMPTEIANLIRFFGDCIPDIDLAEKGREKDPHVTVLYGLHDKKPEEVQKAISDFCINGEGEDVCTNIVGVLDSLGYFATPDADVLYVNVLSPVLYFLNSHLRNTLEHTSTQPFYKPHVTVAYLKPGLGRHYAAVGIGSLMGRVFVVNQLQFCDRKGEKYTIPLGTNGDLIPGGLASGRPDSDFDEDALKAGIEVEMEHTSDPAIAKEIAKDHLTEDPKYYDKLATIELSVQHAPSGGVTIAGQFFKGGEFIPGEVLAKATKEEKKQLQGKNSGTKQRILQKQRPPVREGQSLATSPKTKVKLKRTKDRAFTGRQIPTRHQLSKQAAGSLGEDIILAFLHGEGKKDADRLNAKVNNFPLDAIQNHETIEIKTGQVSNSAGAQQWRLTIGEPGKAEKQWLSKASPEEKKAWNAKKMDMIHQRKKRALMDLQKKLGRKIKASTMTVLINPDTKTADIFRFDGWHNRIGWNSELMQNGYVGSVKYELT